MSDDWRPLFQRDTDEPSNHDVLHEGVPDWLDGSLWRWVMDQAALCGDGIIGRLEARLRMPLTTPNDRPFGGRHTSAGQLLDRFWRSEDDELRLTVIDALLAEAKVETKKYADPARNSRVRMLIEAGRKLDRILTDGGSTWTVELTSEGWRLVRRVDASMTDMVEAAGAGASDAARKIKSAWSYCYRRDPNYDLAYRDAVLAVEALAIPVTVPNSPRASLGTASAHIRDTAARWSVGDLAAKEAPSGETLVAMLGTLWHNQQRHADADGTIGDVSRREAEAAVSLAVVLVHWFDSGLVQKT